MVSRRVALTALVAVVLVPATAVTPVAASPQPTPVCQVCGHQFEFALWEESNEDRRVNVTRSTLDVDLRADGSAHLTARNHLTARSADALRNRSALVDRTVSRLLERHPLGDPEDVSVRLDGDALVVTYTLADVADRRAGVLLVDAFYESEHVWLVPGADRVTLHAPGGFALANDPPAETQNDTAVTWRGSSEQGSPGSALSDQTFVVFASEGAAFPDARGQLAIATAVFPMYVGQLLIASAFPVGLLLAGLGGYRVLGGRLGGEHDPRRLGGLVAGFAALALLGATGADLSPSFVSVLAVPCSSVAALGLFVALTESRPTPKAFAAVGFGTYAVAAALAVRAVDEPVLLGGFVPYLLGLQVVAFGPLGYADARDASERWWLRALVACTVPVAVFPQVPIGGFGPLFVGLFLTALTVAALVAGLPVYYLGVALGTPEQT